MADYARRHRLAFVLLEHRGVACGAGEVHDQLRLLLLRGAHAGSGDTGMALRSWVASANDVASDFPIQNLPYGVFRHRERTNIGVAIGDQILDLHACAGQGLLAPLSEELIAACGAELLNPLMALGPASWSALRRHLIALLNADQDGTHMRHRVEPRLVPMRDAAMQ